MEVLFKDRVDAGKQLSEKLTKYRGRDAVIFALPRGGVVLGVEIAKKLQLPLDLIITRKIGHPQNPEYALCAVTENSDMVCNEEELARVDREWLREKTEKERLEAKRRRKVYLQGRKPISAKDKTAILIDDGAATGLTMLAAVSEIKHQNPQWIVVGIPVIPPEAAQRISSEVDELAAVAIPEYFSGAVGSYYEFFPQVSDEEVMKMLNEE